MHVSWVSHKTFYLACIWLYFSVLLQSHKSVHMCMYLGYHIKRLSCLYLIVFQSINTCTQISLLLCACRALAARLRSPRGHWQPMRVQIAGFHSNHDSAAAGGNRLSAPLCAEVWMPWHGWSAVTGSRGNSRSGAGAGMGSRIIPSKKKAP